MSDSGDVLPAELVERRLAQLGELGELGEALLTAEMPPISRDVFEARSLGIEGRVSERVIGELARSLSGRFSDSRDLVLWASFAGMRRELGWMPDSVIDAGGQRLLDRTSMVLVAITQEFDRPMDAIERGWKTIVSLRVLGPPATSLAALPILDRWDHRTRLWVGSAWDFERARL